MTERAWCGGRAEQRHRCSHLLNMEELGLYQGVDQDRDVVGYVRGRTTRPGWKPVCRTGVQKEGNLDAGARGREDGSETKSSARVPAAATVQRNKETVCPLPVTGPLSSAPPRHAGNEGHRRDSPSQAARRPAFPSLLLLSHGGSRMGNVPCARVREPPRQAGCHLVQPLQRRLFLSHAKVPQGLGHPENLVLNCR